MIQGWGADVTNWQNIIAPLALGGSLTAIGPVAQCYYLQSDRAPSGIAFMVIGNQIARVDVGTRAVATSTGACVGDSEARIKALYPGQVEVAPHKYVEGPYLTVTPAGSDQRRIFETEGARVTRYRAGRLPEVRWIEGCS